MRLHRRSTQARAAVQLVETHEPTTVALAMFSMAFAEPVVTRALGLASASAAAPPVLTSPDAAVADLLARLH